MPQPSGDNLDGGPIENPYRGYSRPWVSLAVANNTCYCQQVVACEKGRKAFVTGPRSSIFGTSASTSAITECRRMNAVQNIVNSANNIVTLSITSAMLSKSVLFDYEPVMAYHLSMKHLPRVPSFIEPFDVADNTVAADSHSGQDSESLLPIYRQPLSILTTLTKSVVTLITLEKYAGLGADNQCNQRGTGAQCTPHRVVRAKRQRDKPDSRETCTGVCVPFKASRTQGDVIKSFSAETYV